MKKLIWIPLVSTILAGVFFKPIAGYVQDAVAAPSRARENAKAIEKQTAINEELIEQNRLLREEQKMVRVESQATIDTHISP